MVGADSNPSSKSSRCGIFNASELREIRVPLSDSAKSLAMASRF